MLPSYQVNNLSSLSKDTIDDILDTTKAILPKDHYSLISDNHSDQFFSFTRISQYPNLVSIISNDFVRWIKNNLKGKRINLILTHATRSQLLAFDVARTLNNEMNTRAVEALIDDKGITQHELRPVQNIVEGENLIIVCALTTTNKSIKTLVDIAKDHKANLLGICLLVSRNKEVIEDLKKYVGEDIPIYIIIEFDWSHYPEEDCEMCKNNVPLKYAKDIR